MLSAEAADATTATLLDALHAVREAIDIPHAATMGDEETRDKILIERTGHVAVMLQSLLSRDFRRDDWQWSTEYLRERLAEHPHFGQYKTWEERVIELEAARKAGAR